MCESIQMMNHLNSKLILKGNNAVLCRPEMGKYDLIKVKCPHLWCIVSWSEMKIVN